MAQINMEQGRVVIHNLHGPDPVTTHRHGAINAFLAQCKGGIGGFNELSRKDYAYLRATAKSHGLAVYIHIEDGAVWDPKVFHVGKARVKKIMQGGHVGADGVATRRKGDDDRRVGPTRYGLYLAVTAIAIGMPFEFVVTHTVARAFTKNKWRRRIFMRSIISLEAGILEADGVILGDMNDPHRLNLPSNYVQVSTPATMGRAHYDQMYRWGDQILITNARAVNTPSDHHMVVATGTFYREPKDHLKPAPPSPGAKPTPKPHLPAPGTAGVNWRKYGAPVAHPWAHRSPRFKRRRRALWRKIVKWQAAYKRNL